MMNAQNMVQWLSSIPGRKYRFVRPVRVVIGKNTYEGAFVAEEKEYAPTERAVVEGPCKAGEKYLDYDLHLLGEKPQHKNKTCYVWDCGHPLDERIREASENKEWFVAAWNTRKDPMYAPHGPFFTISQWATVNYGYYKGWKIDTHERFAYKRMPLSVEFLDAQ